MKKLLALLLAVAIVMTMSLPAFAEEVDEIVDDHSGSATATDKEPSAEIGVYGNYLQQLDSEKILSVIVSWTDMYFEYAKSQQGTWQPESHTYTGAKTDGEWLNNTASITIANHSNMAVTANLAFTKDETAPNVTGTLSKSSVELATAVDTTVENAPKDDVTFTIGGSITSTTKDLGKITVSLDADETDGGTTEPDGGENKPEDGNNAPETSSTLDLSGKEFSEWAALISAYLDEHPGELTVKLGMDSVDYVGDSNGSVDTANMPAHVLNDAVYNYNGGNFDTKVALTLVDVTTIGAKGFIYAAGSFSSISAPNATSIGSQAFQGNQSTKTFNFPNVTSIGISAFDYCGAMESITFGKVITSVSSYSFGSGSDSDFFGKDCHTENVTITLNSAQADYYNGNSTTWGENGTFAGYTWKNVVKG